MNDIREIVTKTIVGKGKKIIHRTDEVIASFEPYSVLGCWVINHNFEASLNGLQANITGSYEIDVWYSYDNNTKTDIARTTVSYNKKINIKPIVRDINEATRDILVEAIQEPTCTNAQINDNSICVDVCFELLAEVIGETKVKVAILEQMDCVDYTDDDFEDEINENFIKEE